MISDNFRQAFGLEDRPKRIERTAEELEQIKINNKNHMQKIKDSRKTKVYSPIKLNNLKVAFKEVFEEMNGPLVLTEDNKHIFDMMSRYFAKDASFNDTDITMNKPSLNKGLLVIGKYGCGKTAMMDTFQEIGKRMMPNNFLWFVSSSTLDIVDEFESTNGISKESFFKKYNDVNCIYFDDFGTEEDASNFGKKNLMKEILEKRYLRKKKTFLTTNLSLLEIKSKYGNRVFDRLQEMFNIIEFTGESFRQ